jgi:hypothetical protein
MALNARVLLATALAPGHFLGGLLDGFLGGFFLYGHGEVSFRETREQTSSGSGHPRRSPSDLIIECKGTLDVNSTEVF